MQHWLKPMLPTKYSEAGCFKCHSSEANIKGADKLTLGLSLIEKSLVESCLWLEDNMGYDSFGWKWGNIHQAEFQHSLSLKKPLYIKIITILI